METQLGSAESGLSGSEFALTIVNLLSTSRTSDDLQTELFDLLGFDRIELIQNVLSHRSEIVESFKNHKKVMQSEIANVALLQQENSGQKMPSYGTQVLVQSEDEKALRKQVRKEEKRMQKLLRNVEEEEEEFDAQKLAIRRQAGLLEAVNKPVFRKEKSPRIDLPPVERYPFVFDSLAEARQSAGFIQGDF